MYEKTKHSIQIGRKQVNGFMSVRIGFIGVGGIAASHLINLVQIPEADVVALCDLSEDVIARTRSRVNERLARLYAYTGRQGRFLEGATYTDYRAMLRSERLDAVYVCLPPFAHGEPEEAVIEAGLPFLVEKPVALHLPLADRLLAMVRERELVTSVGYQTRYTTTAQKAKELLEGKTIGMVVVMRFGSTPEKAWYRFQDKSGGQLIEMATHQVDLLRYLVGEIKTVYAAAATRINHKRQPDYDIHDVNCMTLEFENGVVGNFANNFISGHGTPSEAQGLHIFAEGLTLSIGAGLTALTAAGKESFPRDPNGMYKEDEAFVQAVATGDRSRILSDYENGVRTLAVTLAADHSARTKQPVHVADYINEHSSALKSLAS